MSASKIPLSGLPRGELEALAEQLLAENAALKQAIAELRAEVATLKDVKGRPKLKPSGMEKGTEPKPDVRDRARGARDGKAKRLAIHEERVVKADVPAGSRFKGGACPRAGPWPDPGEDFLVQDLVLRPHVVQIRRERWLTLDGRWLPRCRSASPATSGPSCAGKPVLRPAQPDRGMLFQYHQGQVTVPRLVAQLTSLGIAISKRQIVRLLNESQGAFLNEACEVLRAGLRAASWISVDDTGARHQHQNGVCTQLGNDHFAAFATTGSKSRLNFLEVLRAGYRDYVVNAEALAYMRQRQPAGPVIAQLAAHPVQHFPDEVAWVKHLEQLGIQAHGLLPDTVILSDDAGQFALDRHALCWVHAERLVHKLDAFTDRQHVAQQLVRALIWWFYADLRSGCHINRGLRRPDRLGRDRNPHFWRLARGRGPSWSAGSWT